MRGVYFTILPASPCGAEFYEIWHTRSAHRRNHVCQIFSRSVQGLRNSDTPKIAISHWLAASPLQQCGTTVRHCDPLQTLQLHIGDFKQFSPDDTDIIHSANIIQYVNVHKLIICQPTHSPPPRSFRLLWNVDFSSSKLCAWWHNIPSPLYASRCSPSLTPAVPSAPCFQ